MVRQIKCQERGGERVYLRVRLEPVFVRRVVKEAEEMEKFFREDEI